MADWLFHTKKVISVGCWPHVRRKFYDLTPSDPAPLVDEVLQQIQALYAIEEKIRGLPPDKRKQQRQLHAKPLPETPHDWMNRTLRGLSKGSPLSKAIRYALNQWDALVVYVSHGQVEIDKNMAERSLRPIALGRKNYLFTGRRTCRCDLYLTGHRKTQWPEPNKEIIGN